MGVIIRNGVLYPGGGINPDIIAPTFDTSTDYYAGQCVIYQNHLYQFITEHDAGAWASADVISIDISELLDRVINSFAAPFETDSDYQKGDYVVYKGRLCVYINDHTAGAWDSSEVQGVAIDELLDNVQRMIADDYDESRPYHSGDLVLADWYHEKKLYMITDDISEMSWDDVIANDKAIMCTIADAFIMFSVRGAMRFVQATQLITPHYFDEDSRYHVGDIVIKYDTLTFASVDQCELYRFTSEHTAGPWDDNEVEQITVVGLIDAVNAPTFSEAVTRTNITSGDKLSTLFGKIKKWFTDLKNGAFMDVHITADVTALAGATTVAVTDDSISSTSMIEVFTENQSNKQISVTNYTISNHTVTLTFAALAEDTVFNIRVTNT